mmetsp:Transcript_74864/g.161925  ORF Transcript_74864/g.161925 Transcript_74864/m.161925 type:complete len:263 (+) Transcript_74864:244-1032(+)
MMSKSAKKKNAESNIDIGSSHVDQTTSNTAQTVANAYTQSADSMVKQAQATINQHLTPLKGMNSIIATTINPTRTMSKSTNPETLQSSLINNKQNIKTTPTIDSKIQNSIIQDPKTVKTVKTESNKNTSKTDQVKRKETNSNSKLVTSTKSAKSTKVSKTVSETTLLNINQSLESLSLKPKKSLNKKESAATTEPLPLDDGSPLPLPQTHSQQSSTQTKETESEVIQNLKFMFLDESHKIAINIATGSTYPFLLFLSSCILV